MMKAIRSIHELNNKLDDAALLIAQTQERLNWFFADLKEFKPGTKEQNLSI